jgi:hypothetical protein
MHRSVRGMRSSRRGLADSFLSTYQLEEEDASPPEASFFVGRFRLPLSVAAFDCRFRLPLSIAAYFFSTAVHQSAIDRRVLYP